MHLKLPDLREEGEVSSLNNDISYRRSTLFVILIATVARSLIALNLGFGNDEVYYWTYSQHLQWNYFDHPPMVALMIRLTTLNLTLQQHEFFIRLGSIICSIFAGYFIYRIISSFATGRAGFIGTIFYNASFYGSIITGVFILPDSPEMLFWTASLFMLSKMLRSERPSTIHWILLGILTGLTTMSKIHGIFIWVGLLIYVLFFNRAWLRSAGLYVSAALTLVIVSPILLWNVQNHFITYRYHSSRFGLLHFRGDNFVREIFGEIFYNNPFIVVSTIAGLIWFIRKSRTEMIPFVKVSILIALPMIFSLLFLSMFNDTLPHWTGPAYVTLIPLAAFYLAETRIRHRIPIIANFSVMFAILIVLGGMIIVNYYPGTLGKKTSVAKLGEGDVTLDMQGWRNAASTIDSLIVHDENASDMKDAPLVSDKWFPAAHIDYYIAFPLHKYVVGLGDMNALHNYEWLNAYRLKGRDLKNAYCVAVSNYATDVGAMYAGQFKSISRIAAVPVYRAGRICRYFFLFRLKGFTAKVPEVK